MTTITKTSFFLSGLCGAASWVSTAAAEPAEAASETASDVELSMFADAYLGVQSGKTGSLATSSGHRSYAWQGPTGLAENGFSLSFLGLDASYDNGAVGATGSFRFGSSVPIFHGNSPVVGIDNITQAYLTIHPSDALTLDFGMFGTIFGAEVAESWQNLNYSRGALYFYGQPFWHTGLRAAYTVNDMVSVTGMVVNGTNDISETINISDGPEGSADPSGNTLNRDQTPSIALQVGLTPQDNLSVVAGGMMALNTENNDDAGFDTFFDVVATGSFGDLSLVLNADYIITAAPAGVEDDRTFLGLSAAAGYELSSTLGVAARVEYLTDSPGNGDEDWNLTTATATLDIKPNPNLILRIDGRYETSNQEVFSVMPDGNTTDASDAWFGAVFGVVVTTN